MENSKASRYRKEASLALASSLCVRLHAAETVQQNQSALVEINIRAELLKTPDACTEGGSHDAEKRSTFKTCKRHQPDGSKRHSTNTETLNSQAKQSGKQQRSKFSCFAAYSGFLSLDDVPRCSSFSQVSLSA